MVVKKGEGHILAFIFPSLWGLLYLPEYFSCSDANLFKEYLHLIYHVVANQI